jgi:hypothetical protein
MDSVYGFYGFSARILWIYTDTDLIHARVFCCIKTSKIIISPQRVAVLPNAPAIAPLVLLQAAWMSTCHPLLVPLRLLLIQSQISNESDYSPPASLQHFSLLPLSFLSLLDLKYPPPPHLPRHHVRLFRSQHAERKLGGLLRSRIFTFSMLLLL